MLAKFKNGYFIEVKTDKERNEWRWTVFGPDGDEHDNGWTTIANLELYVQ